MKKQAKKTTKKAVTKTAQKSISKLEDITSYEAACQVTGDDPNALPDVSKLPNKRQDKIIKEYKIGIVNEAINMVEKFVPDFENDNQVKYWPRYWSLKDKKRAAASAFVLANTYYDYTYTSATLGSRLCFGSTRSADHFAEHFWDLLEGVNPAIITK